MIVGNTLSEIGDVLVVDTQMSITGSSIQLVSYTDSTIGETPTRYFDKKFRVSQDGLLYTDWAQLNNFEVSQISGNIINNNLFVQYRYERVGADNTGLLEFVSVNIVGTVVPTVCESPVIDNSIFKGLSCGNFVTTQLCSNLLKKLYKSGIIPEYVERGVSTEQDEDYIAYWSAIACYMSMFVTFMTRFENIYMERNILLEYLKQLNVNFCDRDVTLEELQYIATNYLDEIRKRGSKLMFLRKGELLQDGSYQPLDGEILRLLCIDDCDEFLWTLRDLKHTGWNVGHSSPMYKGTQFDENLIKGFEKTKECLDLSLYKTFGGGYIFTDGTNIVFSCSSLTRIGLGFGDFAGTPSVKDEGVVVNPYLDYEITFSVSTDSAGNLPTINFGCHAFDCLDNKYTLLRIDNDNPSSEFVNGLKIYQPNQKYFVRGIIYSRLFNNITNVNKHLNTANGINLKFDDERTNRILPYIEGVGDTGVQIFIYDYKIRPLRYSHSMCFLNTANVIEIFANNYNTRLTFSKIKDIIRRDLIPYNTVLVWNPELQYQDKCADPMVTMLEDLLPYIDCQENPVKPIDGIKKEAQTEFLQK